MKQIKLKEIKDNNISIRVSKELKERYTNIKKLYNLSSSDILQVGIDYIEENLTKGDEKDIEN